MSPAVLNTSWLPGLLLSPPSALQAQSPWWEGETGVLVTPLLNTSTTMTYCGLVFLSQRLSSTSMWALPRLPAKLCGCRPESPASGGRAILVRILVSCVAFLRAALSQAHCCTVHI